MATRDPVDDLRRIAFYLERGNEATYRVRAFRSAAGAIAKVSADELAERAAAGTLAKLPGVGDVTARCIAESLAGEEPVYLRRVRSTDDQRGFYAELTELGAGVLAEIAPGHVAAVRDYLIDLLTEDELAALRSIGSKVRQRMSSKLGTSN